LLALDPIWCGGQRDHIRVVVGGTQLDSVALVAASGVVVLGVGVEDVVEMALSGDEESVGRAVMRSPQALMAGTVGVVV